MVNSINYRHYFHTLYSQYSSQTFLSSDPIEFCYRYEDPKDIEVIAFISALFAYGNVVAIKKFLESLLSLLTNSPFSFIKRGDFGIVESKVSAYRFQTRKDIVLFLNTLSMVLNQYNSLEPIFNIESKNENKLNIKIVNFQKYFLKQINLILGNKKISYGLQFLIGSGKLNSAHKRYCMFLRWMVRDSFPDFGLYKSIRKEDLIYPTDVHIVRLASILGISNRKTVDFKLAESITQYFSDITKEDPLLYDFPLSRIGILKFCRAKYKKDVCEVCELKKLCKVYKAAKLY